MLCQLGPRLMGRPESVIVLRTASLVRRGIFPMARMVRCGLIQAGNVLGTEHSLGEIRDAMVKKHVEMIAQAAKQKVQILCLQELFYGPYFCAEQDPRWYELTESVPDGPSTKLMQELAAK